MFKTPRKSASARKRPRRSKRRAILESLERRNLLATLTVDLLTDELDGDTSPGDLSLREAIALANSNSEADTIHLPAGNLQLSIANAGGLQENANVTGDLDVTSSDKITIIGQGQSVTTIDGGQIDRVFHLTNGSDVELRSLTITDGRAVDDGGDGQAGGNGSASGGGVLKGNGNLTLVNSTITASSAIADAGNGARGGGIYSSGGTVNVSSSVISNNTATGGAGAAARPFGGSGGGGAFFGNSTSATVTDSKISGNSATAGHGFAGAADTVGFSGGNGYGGGFAAIEGGSLQLTGSSITGNSVAGGQGGIGGAASTSGIPGATGGQGGTARGGAIFGNVNVSVSNSTISANGATGGQGGAGGAGDTTGDGGSGGAASGGGIYGGSFYQTNFNHATITNNNSAGGIGGAGGSAGANGSTGTAGFVGRASAGTQITLNHTLIAQNQGDRDVGGHFNAAGAANLIGNGDGAATLPSGGTLNQIGTAAAVIDAKLGILDNYGGPTSTHSLLDGSPALNVGDPAALPGHNGTPSFDQRGTGFDRIDAGRIDIGAFERKAEVPGLIVTTSSDAVDSFDNVTSLREAITFANSQPGIDTITFASSAGQAFENDALIRLTGGEILISEAVTIDGNSAGGQVVITGDAGDDDITVSTTDITDVAASFGGTPGAADDLLDDNSRIFRINIMEGSADTHATTTLTGLTLTGGRTTASYDGGGAVRSSSPLTITGSTFSGNSTTGTRARGGAIESFQALHITASTISGNRTAGGRADGGGIGSAGSSVTIIASTIRGNSTSGFSSNGGGISANSATIVASTISGNRTTIGGGGGIQANNASIIESTISGNHTAGPYSSGGGLAASRGNITRSTISGNSTAGPNASSGGGISGEKLTVTDSIVLGNVTHGSGVASDEVSAEDLTLTGSNIVGADMAAFDTTGLTNVQNAMPAAVFAATTETLADVDSSGPPEVPTGVFGGTLADNGGPVQTIALLNSNSNPALDVGNTVSPDRATDATGRPRAIDVTGVDNGGFVDAGAFELQNGTAITPDAPSLIVSTANDSNHSFDGLTSLREAVEFANAGTSPADTDGNPATTDVITFASGSGEAFENDALIRLAHGEFQINDVVTIDGSSAGGALVITGDKNDDDVTLAGSDITDVNASNPAMMDDNSRIFSIGQEGSLNSDDAATTTLRGLTLTGGKADGDGGAIRSSSPLTINSSTISGNSAIGRGGGISANHVEVTGSTISGNRTSAYHAYGGGIHATIATITGSTISGNRTTGNRSRGGGLHAIRASIIGTTIAGNSTAGIDSRGGGFSSNDATVIGSTITGNSTAGSASSGGGIYAFSLDASNSIVLGNVTHAAGVTDDEIAASKPTFRGTNIVGANTTAFDATTLSNVQNAMPGDVFVATNETLADVDANGIPEVATGVFGGSLAGNGGNVQTVALRDDASNPAIDVSSIVVAGVITDAAGQPRAVDRDGVNNGGIVDAGAFELQNGTPFVPDTPSLVVTTTDDSVNAFDGANSLREAILYANSGASPADTDGNPATTDVITFASGSGLAFENDALIRLTLGELTINDTVTIDGSSAGGKLVITGDKDDDDLTLAGTEITDVAASFGGTPGAADDLLDDNSRLFNMERDIGTMVDAQTTLIDLTLTGGRQTDDFSGHGGAIGTRNPLTIIGSTISGNSTSGRFAAGGAIHASAPLTILESTLFGNSTSGENSQGGAIFAFNATITGSTISGNRTTGNNSSGGGIFGDRVVLTSSTISGNIASGSNTVGGGLRINGASSLSVPEFNVPANLSSITNSILLGNMAQSSTPGRQEISGNDLIFIGNNIVGANAAAFDATSVANVHNASPTDVFAATIETVPGVLGGVVADHGGKVHTIALRNDPTNPSLDFGLDSRLSEALTGVDFNGDGDKTDTITTDAPEDSRAQLTSPKSRTTARIESTWALSNCNARHQAWS